MTTIRERRGKEPQGPTWLLAVVLGVVVVGAIAAGTHYYRSYESSYRAEVGRQLAAIADLKVGEIVQWRKERLGDAGIFHRNPGFTDLVRRSLGEGGVGRCRPDLRDWLDRFRDAYGYDRVFVLDAHGVERCAAPDSPEPVARHLVERLPALLGAGRIEFLDFHRDEPEGAIHLAVVVPILDTAEGVVPLGALVLRIDPRMYLYPLIKRWPVPSRTAETLLVRRDGADALFLNELRFKDAAALALRMPLTQAEAPAVKAVLGRDGVEEGVDYRGIAVVAATRTIPDSPWALVARVDVAEALEPVRGRLGEVALVVGALLLAAVAGWGFFWRHHRARHYRERYEATAALHAVAARQQALLSAIPDIVMEVDDHSVYTWANLPGLEFFGDDVVGHEAAHYFEGEQETYEKAQPLFAGQEDVVYLESWQRRRDGETRLLAWWCHVLKDSGGRVTGALSTGRDLTESRRAEETLAVHARIASVFLTVPDDGVFDEVLRVVLEVMRSPFGVFGYIDEAGALVVPTMTRQVWDKCEVPEKSIVFPRATWGDSSWPRAIREREPNFSNLISTKTPDGHVTLHRHISLPILLRGKVIGIFQVANKETDYTDTDLATLEAIARYVAPLLGARLHRERAEEALREREELFRAVFDHSTVGKSLTTPAGELKRVNKAFADLLGYELDEMQKLNFATITVPDDIAESRECVRCLLAGERTSYRMQKRYLRKDGPVVWADVSTVLLRDSSGKPLHFVTSVLDITERKRAEEALQQRDEVLQAHNDELVRFSYAVSHDLKSPMVTIKTFLGYLEQDLAAADPARIDKDLHYLHAATAKMSRLLDELLELSRVGRVSNPSVEVTLQEVVGEALDLVAGRIAEADVEVRVTEELIVLVGDRPRLVEVFQNLLDNAAKFMGDQPAPRVEIGCEESGGETVLFVRDNGKGIDPRHSGKLFGLFEKLDPGSEGTGIGLALVKRIVEVHGGRIWVASEGLGHGSTFRFTLAGATPRST